MASTNGDRIHRATSDDGTEIVGRVQGQGPPLVLVHGGIGDGDVHWDALLPHLTDHFTCYLMSTRGRGMSAAATDYSTERHIQDVVAFVDSIGEPVCLMGHSGGAAWSLGAAARTSALTGVALYEAGATEAASEDDLGQLMDGVTRVGAAASEGRLVDATQIIAEDIALANDDELADPAMPRWVEAFAPTVPALLEWIPSLAEPPSPTDPSSLEHVNVPVLVLHGARTGDMYKSAARFLAEHLPNAELREADGVGHFAPQLAPQPVAEELVRFFAGASDRAQHPPRG